MRVAAYCTNTYLMIILISCPKKFTLSPLSQAILANPANLDVPTLDVTPSPGLMRQLGLFKLGPGEIPNILAFDTHHVTVRARVRVKPGAVVQDFQPSDDAETLKRAQCAVNGIQRNGGQFRPNPHIYVFGGWMAGIQGDLPVQLEPLMRQPDTFVPANALEHFQLFFQRFFLHDAFLLQSESLLKRIIP
jgi:hypothetical protein